jgi:hypothetical protein
MTGTDTVTVTNSFGCSASASKVVTVNPVPTPTVNNAVICIGGTAMLTVNGGGTYHWSSGDTTASIMKSVAGVYRVTVTSSPGCTASVNDTVIAIPSIVNIMASRDTVIRGTADTLSANPIPGTVIQWFIGTCGGKGSNYIDTGRSIVVIVDSSTTFFARYRCYAMLSDTLIADTPNVTCSSIKITAKRPQTAQYLYKGYSPTWDQTHIGYSTNRITINQNDTITWRVLIPDTTLNIGLYYTGIADTNFSDNTNSLGYSLGMGNGTYFIIHQATKINLNL